MEVVLIAFLILIVLWGLILWGSQYFGSAS